MKETTCRECGAKIAFVVMSGTGKRMPVNLPAEKRIVEVSRFHNESLFGVRDCYVSHFATCPAADRFRKAGGS